MDTLQQCKFGNSTQRERVSTSKFKIHKFFRNIFYCFLYKKNYWAQFVTLYKSVLAFHKLILANLNPTFHKNLF